MEANLSLSGEAKLHGEMCRKLSVIVFRISNIFPELEAARPRSKSGIQALCALHVALERAKNILQHCSDCSKFYLAITSDSILMKFEKAKNGLHESLRRVEDIVPLGIACQIMDIIEELEGTIFELDLVEKEAGDQMITLLQKNKNCELDLNDGGELVYFHQSAAKLGITSSRAALTERRALKKLIQRVRDDEDKRKEFVVSYLLHLLRRYSKLFRNDGGDDTDSQGSTPCSPTVVVSFQGLFPCSESLSLRRGGNARSENIPSPPVEFRCPISLQLMYDPVIISSGQTYERMCIEKWFDDGHNSCPKTRQQLDHLDLTPNYCVKGLIASWCEQNGVPVPSGPPESLNANYWQHFMSGDSEATDSRSIVSTDSWKTKSSKQNSPESICEPAEELEGNQNDFSCEVDDFARFGGLLTLLCNGNGLRKKKKIVEKIRFLLKDDAETRIYMGANGFVEALVEFLRDAVNEGDFISQEVGAMALFNLAVNNNRNKGLLLSAGILPLLDQMIQNPTSQEPAAALYLNLSCLDDAKPAIGSGIAIPFLIELVHGNTPSTRSTKHDALYTLYNISTHPPNVPFLVSSGVVRCLHSLLAAPSGPSGETWADKAIAVLINVASNHAAKKEVVSAQGLVGSLAALLDAGTPLEQEQAVSCLLVLCDGGGDGDTCIEMVLKEGVIPPLVSVSAIGTSRGKEKAQKLLKLFREQRQRESQLPPSLPTRRQDEVGGGPAAVCAVAAKPLCRWGSKKLVRTLSSVWKSRSCVTFNQR